MPNIGIPECLICLALLAPPAFLIAVLVVLARRRTKTHS